MLTLSWKKLKYLSAVLGLPSSTSSSHYHHRHLVAIMLHLPAAKVCTRISTAALSYWTPTLSDCDLYSVSLLGKPPDTTAMTVATGKNLNAIPRKVGSDNKPIFYFHTFKSHWSCPRSQVWPQEIIKRLLCVFWADPELLPWLLPVEICPDSQCLPVGLWLHAAGSLSREKQLHFSWQHHLHLLSHIHGQVGDVLTWCLDPSQVFCLWLIFVFCECSSSANAPQWFGELSNGLLLTQKVMAGFLALHMGREAFRASVFLHHLNVRCCLNPAFFFFFPAVVISLSYIHRSQPLWRKSPFSNSWWCLIVPVV